MNISIDESKDNKKIDFLKKEYDRYWKHLFFIHEDRSKYVTIFVSLLAGTGYLFFRAVESRLWAIGISIAFLSGCINLLFLKWFMSHRESAQDYKSKLNLIRGILLEDANIDKIFGEKLLSTLPVTYKEPSREFNFYWILIIIISANFACGLYIVFVNFFPVSNPWELVLVIPPFIWITILFINTTKILFKTIKGR